MVNLASFGSFLGGQNGQGGFAAGLLANQQAEQKRKETAAAYQALAQLAKGGAGGAPPGMPTPTVPGASPIASAMPAPNPSGSMAPPPGDSVGGQGGPGVTSMPPSMPGGSSPQGQRFDPEQNMNKQIAVIAGLPGLSDEQRMNALMKMSAYTSPIDKAEQTLQQKQDQIQMQQQRLEDTLANVRYVKQLQVGATERGQDIVSGDRKAALGARTNQQDAGYYDKRVEDARKHADTLVNAGKINSPEYKEAKATLEQARQARDEFKKQGKQKTAAPENSGGGMPLVATQEEFDKLPSGAQYKESDGNTYTKP